jgi:hypothetical protein
MTTFKEFVDRYSLTQEQIEHLWRYLMMLRLERWKEGLEQAMQVRPTQASGRAMGHASQSYGR